ncbi:MAG: hypothetical protein K6F20_09505 [Bacteroidaceae bacterium]|nr:hypothetical protein [Bacteroidaceae bacterium]
MLNVIDHQHESDEEEKRLDAKIEALRQAVSDLDDHITSAKEMCDDMGKQTKSIENGSSKLGEVAALISGMKQRIESMVIPARITPESFQETQKFVDNQIEQEKQLLERHRLLQRQEWKEQNEHLRAIVRDNKGVWLSNKVFWWAIGIFEVAVCLAIYFGGNALVSLFK